jgi:hypothetical protein
MSNNTYLSEYSAALSLFGDTPELEVKLDSNNKLLLTHTHPITPTLVIPHGVHIIDSHSIDASLIDTLLLPTSLERINRFAMSDNSWDNYPTLTLDYDSAEYPPEGLLEIQGAALRVSYQNTPIFQLPDRVTTFSPQTSGRMYDGNERKFIAGAHLHSFDLGYLIAYFNDLDFTRITTPTTAFDSIDEITLKQRIAYDPHTHQILPRLHITMTQHIFNGIKQNARNEFLHAVKNNYLILDII